MLSWLGFKADNSRHGPGQFSLILAKSGGRSHTMSVDVITVRRLFAALMMLAVLFLLWFSYVLFHQFRIRQQIAQLDETKREMALVALENKKQQISQQASLNAYQRLAKRMLQLEANLQHLHQRDAANTHAPSEDAALNGVGGVAPELTPEQLRQWLFQYGDKQLDRIQDQISFFASVPNGYPVDMSNTRLSSGFGLRANPFTDRGGEFHNGQDFAAKQGTPIYATADGIVVNAEPMGGFGNAVRIDHGHDYMTGYGHMSRILVQVGATVHAGDIIGLVGSTGRSTGPHLHYIVYYKGQAIDPITFI